MCIPFPFSSVTLAYLCRCLFSTCTSAIHLPKLLKPIDYYLWLLVLQCTKMQIHSKDGLTTSFWLQCRQGTDHFLIPPSAAPTLERLISGTHCTSLQITAIMLLTNHLTHCLYYFGTTLSTNTYMNCVHFSGLTILSHYLH